MKFDIFQRIESPEKRKKIIASAEVAAAVLIFFVWLGIGMYSSVPENARGSLLPMFLMYLIFPTLIMVLSIKRIYVIIKSDDIDEKPKDDSSDEIKKSGD